LVPAIVRMVRRIYVVCDHRYTARRRACARAPCGPRGARRVQPGEKGARTAASGTEGRVAPAKHRGRACEREVSQSAGGGGGGGGGPCTARLRWPTGGTELAGGTDVGPCGWRGNGLGCGRASGCQLSRGERFCQLSRHRRGQARVRAPAHGGVAAAHGDDDEALADGYPDGLPERERDVAADAGPKHICAPRGTVNHRCGPGCGVVPAWRVEKLS
jgi:hypothetical protein